MNQAPYRSNSASATTGVDNIDELRTRGEHAQPRRP